MHSIFLHKTTPNTESLISLIYINNQLPKKERYQTMPRKYEIEREGQIDFFKNYKIPYDEDNSILTDDTDGIYNGVLLEFKLNINNLNSTLFQAIKYLSRIRIKGENLPAKILLIDLNSQNAYEYNSKDYLCEIEKEYVGAASKNNTGFIGNDPTRIYNYDEMEESNNLKKLLKNKKTLEEKYIPINIDETCIVGWAERYYRENPKAKKGDFIGDDEGVVKITGEIREPVHFKGLINPYKEKTNVKFKYLMDCLNDRLQKKDLGAFYTPEPYAKKAAELVKLAVDRAIDGGKKDYIVLDRAAGTGALEVPLIGLYDKNGDEIISHTVISTFEYYEYKVLNERLGDKVRDIIPPTEADVIYSNGTVANADAMSEEYINNPIIKKYLDDKDCAIIMLENPPYRDITASDKVKVKEKSFVYKKFVEEGTNQSAHRELSNLFIWSAFKYYLREDTDSYIVFSPIKYFKYNKIPNTKFKKGFIFNRKHFHASPASISCIYWSNMQGKSNVITLEIYDINENKAHYIKKVDAKRMYNTFNKFNDKRAFEDDVESDVYVENGSGQESEKVTNKTAIYNGNIIAYLRATSINLNAMSRCLTRTITYDALTQSYGFYIRKDNYLKKLPLFVAKLFPLDNWYEKDFLFTSSDGGDAYTKDETFLKSCLIYTCLSNQNKCLSFTGSDGRYYKNELCFEEGTLASKDLKSYNLDESEKELLDIWEQILEKAKKTKNYNKDLSYGVYQITKELNTFQKVKIGKTIKNSYDYPELNGDLETLRVKLKEYYKSHIWNKMFNYELVK